MPVTSPKRPFSFVDLAGTPRQEKPRQRGLTLMSDWGLGLARARDLLETAGPFLDIAKIAAGTARLYDEALLAEKLALYRSHAVRPYLGGQFMEFVFATQGASALPGFLKEAHRLGMQAAEVSENCVTLPPGERKRQIELIRDNGMDVFAEVGSKSEASDPRRLAAQAAQDLEDGAEMVLVEGAEMIVSGRINSHLVSVLSESLDVNRIMFELPTTRIGSTLPEIHNIKKRLIEAFGPDVSLANLGPDDIMETESLRVGLGVVGPSGPGGSGSPIERSCHVDT
jgi:phosphosulfolactate synthase